MSNFLNNKLPAQESPISPLYWAYIAPHISLQHTAQKTFTVSKSSSKLKWVVRKNTGKFDQVLYKRDDKVEWKGPGQALGQNGPAVLITHGLLYIKADACRVQLANPNLDNGNLNQTRNVPLSSDIPKTQQLIEYAIDNTNNEPDNQKENISFQHKYKYKCKVTSTQHLTQ